MESAICLRHYPFPYGSKGFQGARPSRFHHLKINHATPLSLPQISTTRSPVTRSFGHVNCMLERFISVPSENEGSGNRILRGVAAASLVLTCVLGLFSFSGKNMNPKLTTAYANTFPSNKSEQTPGMHALESLLKIPRDEALAKEEIPSNYGNLGPSARQVNILKWLAIGQSKYPDRGNEAHKTLKDQYTKLMNRGYSDSEDLGLALVEVLMFKGEFKTALDLLDKIIGELVENKDNQPSGLSKLYDEAENDYEKLRRARLILYKAILHTVLGKEEKERKQWWNAFMETCRK